MINNPILLDTAPPIINHAPVDDGVLSILSAQACGRLIIYENFTQIYYSENLSAVPWVEFGELFEFKSWPLLQAYRVPHCFIQGDYKSFIRKALQEGMYCLYNHESYFISQYRNAGYEKNRHEFFVYGYQDDHIFCGDYFDYTYYTNHLVDFSEAERAYTEWISSGETDYLNGMVLYKFTPDEHYSLNLETVYVSLKTLIYGSGLPNQMNPPPIGFGYFDALSSYIQDEAVYPLTIKLFNFVWAHTTIMYERARYISKWLHCLKKDRINEIHDINVTAKIMVTLAIKYNIKKEEALRQRLLQYCQTIKRRYQCFLIGLIRTLEQGG